MQRRAAALETSLQKERVRGGDLEEGLAASEAARADAAARCEAYEAGVYGLPQAALEIRQLKESLGASEARVRRAPWDGVERGKRLPWHRCYASAVGAYVCATLC